MDMCRHSGDFALKLDKKLRAELMAIANALADAARPATLAHFRKPALRAENKSATGFDPVTNADRAAESAMRDILARKRPMDGILGEEFGPVASRSGLTWVLDPIDGTRGFISGTPTWGVLIAVNAGAGPIFGMIDQPHIGERFIGGFGVSELRDARGVHALGVRRIPALGEAVIFSTFPEIGTHAEQAVFQRLADRCRLTRYGMDCYAYALLAAGQIDLVVEAGLSPYDIQAPIAVIEAAGGVVTNWRGGPAHDGGQVLAAGSRELHRAALEILGDPAA